MNERIKQLMVESGAYDYYEINEGVNNDEQAMVKFAELIVRECADICDQIDTEYGGEDVLASWCSSAILKRFGYD